MADEFVDGGIAVLDHPPEEKFPIEQPILSVDERFGRMSAKYVGKRFDSPYVTYKREFDMRVYHLFPGTQSEVYLSSVEDASTIHSETPPMKDLNNQMLAQEPYIQFFCHTLDLSRFDGHPKDVQQFISVILSRYKDFKEFAVELYPDNLEYQKGIQKDAIKILNKCLDLASEDPNFRLTQEQVLSLYRDADSEFATLLPNVLFFDNRNKPYGQSVGIEVRIVDKMGELLASKDSIELERCLSSLSKQPEVVGKVLLRALSKVGVDGSERIVGVLASHIGLEKIRKTLREYAESNPDFSPILHACFDYMNLDPATDISISLIKDVYNKIEFSQYKPNEELQEFEENLLAQEFEGKKDILDVACGTGRLTVPLKKSGFDVKAVDIVPKHIEYIKSQDPDIDVQLATWFDVPFEDKAFDGLICLGRSLTHNTTIPDMVKCFVEMRRVLRDDGCVILDFPDPEVGEYKKLIRRTEDIVRKKGLQGTLKGTIIDSPDSTHYFDRFAPSKNAVIAMAALAGFEVKELPKSRRYKGTDGVENSNTYWKLTKMTPDRDAKWNIAKGSSYDIDELVIAAEGTYDFYPSAEEFLNSLKR